MKFLVAGLVKNIQLERLSQEAKKLGFTVDGCYASDLIINASPGNFELNLIGKKITEYDLVYLVVSKRRWEWYQAAQYLHEVNGTLIVNQKVVDPDYKVFLTSAADYKKQVDESLPFPKSSIVFSKNGAELSLTDHEYPVILKLSGGRQGRGVFKAENKNDVFKIIEENEEAAPFTIREFIPNDGDIRVFTVGYRAIGAMKRTPTKEGEFRSNISQGGKGEKYDLAGNFEIGQIAEKLSEITRTEIAGVDIIINKETGKPYILEINPGPQFAGLEKFTGVNAAEAIIKYFENKCTAKK